MKLRSCALVGLLVWCVLGPSWPAQSETDEPDEAQARAVLDAAIQAMGGPQLRDIKTIVSSGKFSQFTPKGELILFSDFIDYIVYPDRERTEFGTGKKRYIQANVGSTGWIYDGEQKALKDQTDEQIGNFQRSLRRNLDNLLRRAQRPGVKLTYLGEKEIWFRQRGRGVRIHLPLETRGEDVIELYIDPLEQTPIKVGFDDGEEDRFFLFREYDGVHWPMRIDHYKQGVQSSRIAYSSIEFNKQVDPALFEKPPNADKVK